MTYQDEPYLSTITAAESYRAQSADTVIRDATPGRKPGRPREGVSVWTEEDWTFYVNAISQKARSWRYKELTYPDANRIEEIIDRNKSSLPELSEFDPAFFYRVSERPHPAFFHRWTPDHNGTTMIATICHPSGECIHFIEFEIEKVLASGKFTVRVWNMASVLIDGGASEVRTVFDGEAQQIKLEFSEFKRSVIGDIGVFLQMNQLEAQHALNLVGWLWDILFDETVLQRLAISARTVEEV